MSVDSWQLSLGPPPSVYSLRQLSGLTSFTPYRFGASGHPSEDSTGRTRVLSALRQSLYGFLSTAVPFLPTRQQSLPEAHSDLPAPVSSLPDLPSLGNVGSTSVLSDLPLPAYSATGSLSEAFPPAPLASAASPAVSRESRHLPLRYSSLAGRLLG